jgi:cytochrome c
MCSWPERLAAMLVGLAALAAQAGESRFAGIGRPATPSELAAWDIDVRPDFAGLPKGSGSVAQGQAVWDAKCASCHGVFGESNEVFSPLVGGTTAADIASGRVARLADASYPMRSSLMKLSTVSTLWDYIRRAMPWNAPKSLSTDEVYAATAYLLNLGGIVPDDFVLSNANIAEVQQRLPNRNGMTREHGLWPWGSGARGKPDTHASACMKDCTGVPRVASTLPAFARDAHGDLAEQNRLVGAQHGLGTAPAKGPVAAEGDAAAGLLQASGCTACHALESRLVGPSLREVAARYAGRADAAAYLAGKIRSGGSDVWGASAMPPQSLPEPDAQAIARWLAAGAKP